MMIATKVPQNLSLNLSLTLAPQPHLLTRPAALASSQNFVRDKPNSPPNPPNHSTTTTIFHDIYNHNETPHP
jgi:hypothetical protein